ncbi:hypothetical protein DACRYDRAFT_103144 [Dacryopinax primogenitus]|uniref:Uncharacterized protein n=1 Tax=Dacryopinax primogenitus (strain DJM 731) TaxID=1858805 RepID=M5G7N6_DACPD|nr:uncharacterized protein DACRYDRAFT_103144 [Dacryopinax primogenitus]EJU06201.1 hypothetical protein DACRYDRAFT_103144 [Dacryopinax primogenitus]
MPEDKSKSIKSKKRVRDDEPVNTPQSKRLAQPSTSSSGKRGAHFRAPAFIRAAVQEPDVSSDATIVESVKTPLKSALKKGCMNDKVNQTSPTPISDQNKPKDATAKANKTSEFSPAPAKENRPITTKPPRRSIHAPFVSPKIMNPALAAALKSKATLPRMPSHGPARELTLVEKRDLLKRAVHVTKDDDTTGELIVKWRSAGREIITDFYRLVKDSGMLESMPESEEKQSGYGGSSWGYGPQIQSRFDTSWGWLDFSKKPESGWGWGTVNEHMAEGDGHEDDYERDDNEESELPSTERLRKELEAALDKPFKKRESLLPLGGSFAFDDAAGDAKRGAIEERLKLVNKKQEKKSWGVGRMLDELGIPHKLFGWDEEEEDWQDVE